MKSISIIKKNLKLLIRSKSSAFIVLLGPLLIILLVGLVFTTKSSYELSIGYYNNGTDPEKNNFSSSFVEALKQSNYTVTEFRSENDCVSKIEEGVIHTCIIFPENFTIKNNQIGELRFLVDYSRINLVYKVIESVSSLVEAESNELSYSLTQTLISKINSTVKDLNSESTALDSMNSKLSTVLADVGKAKSNTDSMKLNAQNISLTSLNSKITQLNTTLVELKLQSSELVNETNDIIDDLAASGENVSEQREIISDFEKTISKLNNASLNDLQSLDNAIKQVSSSMRQLESDLAASKVLNSEIKQKMESAQTNLASVQASLADLKKAIAKSKQNLENIGITSAETIVSPVNTRIEPMVMESSKMTFTFPFLLVLVIMFVALLLSSTLILFEKNSKSFFRVSITPTQPSLFVTTTFLTSLIIILLQTVIILGLANYFLKIPLAMNPLPMLIILLVTIAFFIVIGMVVGYLFSTQEGAIMASIVLGALFMFLSNLVIPLESIAPSLAGIIKYNPYVISSELLRKALLFKMSISIETFMPALMLLAAAVLIFLLILLIKTLKARKKAKLPKKAVAIARTTTETSRSFGQGLSGENVSWQNEDISSDEKNGSGEKKTAGKAIGKAELYKRVSAMTKSEFEDSVNDYQHKIADWTEQELGDKKLAAHLRKTTSRKEITTILKEEAEKESKAKDEDSKDVYSKEAED